MGTLDTLHDVRRYSRASILRILANRQEHEIGCFRPRAKTEISIGPNHGDPRSAEASEVRPCAPRCVTISQSGRFPTLPTIPTSSLIEPSLFRIHRNPLSTLKHTEYLRSRLRGYCGRSIPTPPQRASPTRETTVPPCPGLEPVVSHVLGRSRSRYRQPPPSNGTVALPPWGFARCEKGVHHLFERIPKGGALSRIPRRATSLERTRTAEYRPIRSNTAAALAPTAGTDTVHQAPPRTPPGTLLAWGGWRERTLSSVRFVTRGSIRGVLSFQRLKPV